MDALDIRIIDVLQERGDMTMTELAESTGSTASTCLRRISELKNNGVLTKNVYHVNPTKLGRSIKAIITVETKDHPLKTREKFAVRLKRERAITTAYGVTGEVDTILIANFCDMEEYQGFCDRLFDGVDTIVRYTTYFATETYMENVGVSGKI